MESIARPYVWSATDSGFLTPAFTFQPFLYSSFSFCATSVKSTNFLIKKTTSQVTLTCFLPSSPVSGEHFEHALPRSLSVRRGSLLCLRCPDGPTLFRKPCSLQGEGIFLV